MQDKRLEDVCKVLGWKQTTIHVMSQEQAYPDLRENIDLAIQALEELRIDVKIMFVDKIYTIKPESSMSKYKSHSLSRAIFYMIEGEFVNQENQQEG